MKNGIQGLGRAGLSAPPLQRRNDKLLKMLGRSPRRPAGLKSLCENPVFRVAVLRKGTDLSVPKKGDNGTRPLGPEGTPTTLKLVLLTQLHGRVENAR